MRIKNGEFEAQVKEALRLKHQLPSQSELALFDQAEDLLSKRREALSLRKAHSLQANQIKAQRIAALQQMASKVLEFFAIHPNTPAFATTFLALILAFIALNEGRSHSVKLSYSNLPVLPKTNDFSAHYEEQWLAERQAYEREVEDAHKKTSGGI